MRGCECRVCINKALSRTRPIGTAPVGHFYFMDVGPFVCRPQNKCSPCCGYYKSPPPLLRFQQRVNGPSRPNVIFIFHPFSLTILHRLWFTVLTGRQPSVSNPYVSRKREVENLDGGNRHLWSASIPCLLSTATREDGGYFIMLCNALSIYTSQVHSV